jgi:hypothetical protein
MIGFHNDYQTFEWVAYNADPKKGYMALIRLIILVANEG